MYIRIRDTGVCVSGRGGGMVTGCVLVAIPYVVNDDIVATSRVRWNIQEHSVNC